MNPICNSVHVRVPATSANLGSGFDTVGLALDYHDELTFTLNDDPNDGIAHVIIHGEGADALPCDETHLVVSTFRRACATFGLGRLGFTLEATNNIPQARGMGSSAEAIVAGIAAAAAFAQTGDLNRPAVFDMAAQIEGHPDNVAPAVFGGLTVSWDFETAEGVGSVAVPGGEPLHGGFHAVNYPVDPSITAAVFVPDYELSTEKARQALPRELPYKDAVYNVSRVGLLPAAMNPVVLAQAAQQGKSGVAAAPAQDADTCACSGGPVQRAAVHRHAGQTAPAVSRCPDAAVHRAHCALPLQGLCRRSLRCRPLRARAALRQRPRSHRPDRIGAACFRPLACASPAHQHRRRRNRASLSRGEGSRWRELAAAGGLRVVRHTGRDHPQSHFVRQLPPAGA